MPRPRLTSQVPWCLTQTFLRIITLFFSFLSIVFFGAAAALYNDKILSIPHTGLDTPLITDLITIILLACSCIWCGILITICLHSVACCSTMPHPGVVVSVDLIVWTGLVTTMTFTVMGSVAIESTDIDLALCPEYDYYNRLEIYCTPAFSTVKILEIFGFSMMALSTILHIISFGFACRQTHQLRMMRKRERARIDNAIELNSRGHGIAAGPSAPPSYLESTAAGSETDNSNNAVRKVDETKKKFRIR